MPLYEDRSNSENKIKIKPETANSVIAGNSEISEKIADLYKTHIVKAKSSLKIAIDGWYGVNWAAVLKTITLWADSKDLKISVEKFSRVFKSSSEIDSYNKSFLTDDPGFGFSNTKGRIEDIVDHSKIVALKKRLSETNCDVVIIYGCGSVITEMTEVYDIIIYADVTQQQLLWQMWDGNLEPFGSDAPKKNYFWKEYYYSDFYLLHNHKPNAFKFMHYYLDTTDTRQIKLVPKAAFDEILSTLVRYPVKEVKIFQPGPWGAYRYRDLFRVEGLECNAWNELAGPELNILIDIGKDFLINMPVMNLLEYGEEFVGTYISENLPGMIPFDVWLNDGYFPDPVPQERSSMPIHNHPSTDYVKRHFNEPLGRYETYYIAEAYEGANTMMGFREGADLELWEHKCRESWEKQEPIADWKEFIRIWPSNVGDLYVIPPGTTHGHGGNQMVLEMDTSASPCGTEYSFFMYDFMRPSWDDVKKSMTGKPMNMHLEHGFDNEKWRTEGYVKDNLLVHQPDIIKWTKEYAIDRYKMISEMPFVIERIHFTQRAEYDTSGKFMHIPTLTVGRRVRIRSLTNQEWETELDIWQACLIPAGFGKYECTNMAEGACTLVLIRWKKG